MKVFYYIFCIVELVSINVILIKNFIDVFSFNLVFKTISQFLEIQYVFHYLFIFIFDDNDFKRNFFLIKQ